MKFFWPCFAHGLLEWAIFHNAVKKAVEGDALWSVWSSSDLAQGHCFGSVCPKSGHLGSSSFLSFLCNWEPGILHAECCTLLCSWWMHTVKRVRLVMRDTLCLELLDQCGFVKEYIRRIKLLPWGPILQFRILLVSSVLDPMETWVTLKDWSHGKLFNTSVWMVWHPPNSPQCGKQLHYHLW